MVEGKDLSSLENEAGGHRIQRVPRNERQGRVHSSTVTVAIVAADRGYEDVRVNPGDLKVEYYSGTGAGGQHRNKHQNSVRITHLPTGLMRTAQTRSRDSSYREAMEALRMDLDAYQRTEQSQSANCLRRRQVGSGERSDKRRTYRFQENRVIDHVTGKAAPCSMVMNGGFDLLQ